MKTATQTAATKVNVTMKVTAFISNVIAICFTSIIAYNVTSLLMA